MECPFQPSLAVSFKLVKDFNDYIYALWCLSSQKEWSDLTSPLYMQTNMYITGTNRHIVLFYTKKYLVHIQVTRHVTEILHMYLQTVCKSVHSVCISQGRFAYCTLTWTLHMYMQTALSTVNNLSIVIHLICCESILYSSFIFILFPCAAVSQWISPTAVQQK